MKFKVMMLDDGTYLVKNVKGQFKKSLTELTLQELRKTITTLGSTANKRINRILDSGVYSPAVKALQEKQNKDRPHFSSMEGIDYGNGARAINQLRGRLAQIKKFLDSDTSTVTGARRYKKDVENRLGLEKASDKALSIVWSVISRVKETNPIIANYSNLGNYIYCAIKDDVPDISELDSMSEGEISDLVDSIAQNAAEVALEDYYDAVKSANNPFFM